MCQTLCNVSHLAADVKLKDLLQFITGAPYFISDAPVLIHFSKPTYASPLPVVRACAGEMELPTVHRTYESFRQAMKTALEYGRLGFCLA